MKANKLFKSAIGVFALVFGTQLANANTICSGCELINSSPGTYIGLYNTITFDHGTFTHTDIVDHAGALSAFADFWVFDLDTAGSVSISANYTTFTGITDFGARLWSDAGTSCASTPSAPSSCASIVPGSILASVAGNNWEILASLAAGRYIIEITGETRASGPSAYSGQLGTVIPLPGALVLFASSLLGLGITRRQRT